MAETVWTGMYYVSLAPLGGMDRDPRLFIGTIDEAVDEFKEELKTIAPDIYERKDRRFWQDARTHLALGVTKSTDVVFSDVKRGMLRLKIERHGPLKQEERS